MNVDTSCPRCHQIVSEERVQASVIVCDHCGYTRDQLDSDLDSRHDKQFLRLVLIGAVLMVTAFIHFVHWDNYSVAITPLKLKQWTGLASADELRLIADICLKRMNYECTESAWIDAYSKDPKNVDTLFQLGDLQRKLGEVDSAARNLQAYFSHGGDKSEAAYSLAQVLESKGQFKDAQDYYSRALLAKPDVLQITVIQAYVNMLMKTHQDKEATAVIDDVRKRNGPEGKYFMAKEYDQLTHSL